ncbi:hypothetical protein N779_27805, partial [Vibrio coralliilyticus OCN008]
SVSTKKGKMILSIEEDDQVTVNMGVPEFEPNKIPFKAKQTEKTYILRAEEKTLFCGAVSMGNPHVVTVVDDTQTADVDTLGPLLESHERFPERVNAGFMQVLSRNEVNLRVYERGAGETQACGSGACGAVAVGIVQELLDEKVTVNLPGGSLKISWQGPGKPLYMTGPATHVFDGQLSC